MHVNVHVWYSCGLLAQFTDDNNNNNNNNLNHIDPNSCVNNRSAAPWQAPSMWFLQESNPGLSASIQLIDRWIVIYHICCGCIWIVIMMSKVKLCIVLGRFIHRSVTMCSSYHTVTVFIMSTCLVHNAGFSGCCGAEGLLLAECPQRSSPDWCALQW